MKHEYSFIQLSSDFSQEHADAHFDGKESENNVKFRWEDAIQLSEGTSFVDKKEGEYVLVGETESGAFSFTIPNMLLENYTSDQGDTVIAVSKSIVLERKENVEDEISEVVFYLTDEDLVINPIPGVYISVEDFPEELK